MEIQKANIRLVLFIIIVASVICINRPVYKVSLTQKGFAQFLQYDLEAPPIREFTFCIWLRVFDLSNEQTIFTYIANGNNRVVRLWLDSGGQHIKISLNGRTSSTLVDITKTSWRHICISFQSDFGAWALYLDGVPNGIEGEVFGAYMILTSTIQRNYSMRYDPQFQQKYFHRNKLLPHNNLKYVVLNNLSDDVLTESSRATRAPFHNTTRSFVKFKTAFSEIEHDVGLDDISQKRTKTIDSSNEKEILDLTFVNNKQPRRNEDKINFWNLVNEAGNIGKFKGRNGTRAELSSSSTHELPTISEFEIPPPPTSFQDYIRTNVKIKKPIITPLFELKGNKKTKTNPVETIPNSYQYKLSDVEVPPPPEKNNKVYGQWTSSQFANSVLHYLKRFNYENKVHTKIPSTIPLLKISDTFPYPSEFKVTKVHAPLIFQRKRFRDHSSINIQKRDIKYPQINVEILQDNLRSQILESHAKLQTKDVEIISRGQIKNPNDQRNYRKIDNQFSSNQEYNSGILKPQPFLSSSKINFKNNSQHLDRYQSSNLMTILPFIKSSEYFVEENDSKKNTHSNDIYTNSLSHVNKWNNVKFFSNNHTPRHFNMESEELDPNIIPVNKKSFEINKKHFSINLKYVPENHKIVKNVDENEILNARALATEISNTSNANTFSNSILKYNHGFLPTRNKNVEIATEVSPSRTSNMNDKRQLTKDNFNKNVKIGNALNERYVIGNSKDEKKQSFVGGNEKIPDINRYRSDLDRNNEKVPPSLGPKICKNVEQLDRLFYIQPDGSVDVTHVWSPMRERNMGINFVSQNYKICSLEDSNFQRSPLLFIDWSRTPVRLFGGAYPKKTTDLCGFF
ncbi:unnamed protein product, partial [Brenthis ino]